MTALSLLLAGLALAVDPLLFDPVRTALIALFAGAFLLLARLFDAPSSRFTALPGLILLAVCLLSAVRSSYVWNGLQYGLMAGGVFGFWLLWRRAESRASSLFAWFYALVSLVLLVPILLQYFHQIDVFGSYGWLHLPNGPLRNPNVMARFFGLGGLFLLVAAPRRGFRWAAVPLLAGCLWTGSRGGILALTVALAVIAWQRYGPRWSWRGWTMVAVGVLLVAVVLVGDPSALTNRQRLQLIPETLGLWSGHPFTGVGGWNFGLEYPGVSADGRWQRHPHSLPLLVLGEFGLLGLAVGGLALVGGYRHPPRSSGWPLLVFLGVHELVDTMVWIPGVLLWTAPALAWITVRPEESGSERPGLPGTAYPILLVGLALVVGGIDVTVSRGIRAAGQGAWPAARSLLWDRLTGIASAHRALAARRTGEEGRALASLLEANHRNRLDPYYPFLLSRVLERRGRTDWAVRARREALRRDPHDMLRMRRNSTSTAPSDPPVGTIEEGYDTEPFQPDRLRAQPHRARWYLPLVDRAIREKDVDRALEQLRLLEDFNKVSAATRAGIVARRIRCYRIRDEVDAARRWRRVLRQLRTARDRVRPQFHRFFYRRAGHDHAFLR